MIGYPLASHMISETTQKFGLLRVVPFQVVGLPTGGTRCEDTAMTGHWSLSCLGQRRAYADRIG